MAQVALRLEATPLKHCHLFLTSRQRGTLADRSEVSRDTYLFRNHIWQQ